MRCLLSTRLAIAVTIAISSTTAVVAQQHRGGAAPQGTAKADPGAKKVLGFADIGRWNRIGNAALSFDGKWMTYIYTPNEGDGTLYVRQLDGDKKYTIPVG